MVPLQFASFAEFFNEEVVAETIEKGKVQRPSNSKIDVPLPSFPKRR